MSKSKAIFANESLVRPKDFLHNSRVTGNLPRCHVLDVPYRGTLAEHLLNCYLTFRFALTNGLISQSLTPVQVTQVSEYLLTHDLEEAAGVGDIPYNTAKLLDMSWTSEVREEVLKHFGIKYDLGEDLYYLVKMFDMVDFVFIANRNIPMLEGYNLKRLTNIRENALSILGQLNEKGKYKLDWEKLF